MAAPMASPHIKVEQRAPAGPDLSHIDTWIFDLDNTLYHPRANLFGQIDVKMGAFIQTLLGVDATEARTVQKRYFRDHGTTLRGLMANHGIDPHSFLDYVHDIDVSVLDPTPHVADALARLPGRKLVFTNGDGAYANRVLKQLALDPVFEGVHCIIASDFIPKPQPEPYRQLVEAYGVDPNRALFVEDMARNLKPAKDLGMTTLWVANGSEWGELGANEGHVDWVIDCVETWLTGFDPVAGEGVKR
jgi:putative hydrolase of the HAD superfamily